jgi:hypothetical protein
MGPPNDWTKGVDYLMRWAIFGAICFAAIAGAALGLAVYMLLRAARIYFGA